MIKLTSEKKIYEKGKLLSEVEASALGIEASRGKTIAGGILAKHSKKNVDGTLGIKFDALASHDITYVGIIQTARASGLEKFPVPYVMTNCHNSLCAVGGTINEDDHVFGLSAAKKYGGIFVPPHVAVIHQYMREAYAGCGKMILGSDSHTRYGALGALGVGEGGPEIVKQLLSRTYDIAEPEVIAVKLTGSLALGVGPQDVALSIIGEVFKNGFVKNKIMEFIGDGISSLSVDYRIGIDVMTTETACLSSVWRTDEKVRAYLNDYGRESDYAKLEPTDGALYDGVIEVDLSSLKPVIALPFHPSNVFVIDELKKNAYDILGEVERKANEGLEGGVKLDLLSKLKDGKIFADQGIIAGCAGGSFENIIETADILGGSPVGVDEFSLSVYPASQALYIELVKNGAIARLMQSGVIVKTAFCGPCFGAGDVPSNNGFSIRHTTRNFPNREGSKPSNGQIAGVALMDARSIAATAKRGGELTASSEADYAPRRSGIGFSFDDSVYASRIYDGFGKSDAAKELKFGPNIADWPAISELKDTLALSVASAIFDEVTTTDELIPSGETSSYRSNPFKLAEFTLSRKDPGYVARAKSIAKLSDGEGELPDEISAALSAEGISRDDCLIKSCVFALRPGDGSAREQAASCQRVLGGGANIAFEYATKRYRSNLINWGMLPLTTKNRDYAVGDVVVLKGVLNFVNNGGATTANVYRGGKLLRSEEFSMGNLTPDERKIILSGCLINYYRSERG